MCGIYANHPHTYDAYRRAEEALAEPSGDEIAGVIEAWGKVELHTIGFRAEWARVATLFATPSTMRRCEALAEAYGARALLVPSRSTLRRELEKLDSLAPATVASLLVDERILVLTPARGDRWSNGFELAEIDVDEDETRGRSGSRLGMSLSVAPRGAGADALQDRAFNLARDVRLELEERSGGVAVSVWDKELRHRLGLLRGQQRTLAKNLEAGNVRRAIVTWQWRERGSGRRTAIRILATPLKRVAIRAGHRRPHFEIEPGELVF